MSKLYKTQWGDQIPDRDNEGDGVELDYRTTAESAEVEQSIALTNPKGDCND